MDSMVGYRGTTEYLGKAAARLDDAVNLIPARVSALLLLASGWLARLPAGRAWRTMRSDRGATASPNAGVTMSAMAGLLGVRLEKPGHYVLGQELREPEPADIDRAVTYRQPHGGARRRRLARVLAGRARDCRLTGRHHPP